MKKKIAKLFAGLNRIGKDKYQHFALGAVLAATVLLAVWWLTGGAAVLLPARNTMTVHFPVDDALADVATGFGPATGFAGTPPVIRGWAPLLLSVVAVVTAALVKEHCIDERADPYDLLATLAGGAVVWTVAYFY